MTPAERGRADEFFERLVAGEIGVETEEARSFLAAHPEYAERLEEAQRMKGALDRVGAFERSVVQEAEALGAVEGEERLIAALPPRAKRAPHRLVWASLAAVLLVALGLGFWRPWQAEQPIGPDQILGSALELGSPVGAVSSFARFEWAAGAGRYGWYVVVVRDPADGSELHRSGNLEASSWDVPQATWSEWPERILWEVEPYDPSGRPGQTQSAEAWLER